MYCLLLRRMPLNCIAWVETCNNRNDSWEGGGTCRYCQRNKSVLLYGLLSTGRHLLGVFVYNKPKVESMRGSNDAPTVQKITDITRTKHNCSSSQMHFNSKMFIFMFVQRFV
jgi:hypothetical protein